MIYNYNPVNIPSHPCDIMECIDRVVPAGTHQAFVPDTELMLAIIQESIPDALYLIYHAPGLLAVP